jgi:para-aminobenzoate synthetase component 1
MARGFDHVVILNGGGSDLPNGAGKPDIYGFRAGFGVNVMVRVEHLGDIEKAERLIDESPLGAFVVLSYGLAGLLEPISRVRHDDSFEKGLIFSPLLLTERLSDTEIRLSSVCLTENEVRAIIKQAEHEEMTAGHGGKIKFQIPENGRYKAAFEKLKDHIRVGDIYEVNLCVEHAATALGFDPYNAHADIDNAVGAPFSSFVRMGHRFASSHSPERFMCGHAGRVWSQPMKGTARRAAGQDSAMDLATDPKERAENIMITDLVRNDLSRHAQKGSVRVDELCGVYPLGPVYQMISTVSCLLRPEVHPLRAVLSAFPMGSMTGAPKVRAMQLIDQNEDFARGLYSGSVGYFDGDGSFDLNVMIRSVFYDAATGRLRIPTGSALTISANADSEYAECLLKAEAIINGLG